MNPSCHAKRLALWGIWLEETLLAEVPHRQVVLTVPKRLRPYFLYDRKLLGEKRDLMDIETAQCMLAWPHSGFHTHDGVWVLGRMEYDEEQSAVTYHSDKPTGPTAGSETTDALYQRTGTPHYGRA